MKIIYIPGNEEEKHSVLSVTGKGINLIPENSDEIFQLGRFFQKFPSLGLTEIIEQEGVPFFKGLHLPELSLLMLLKDCIKKFDTD